MRRLACLAVLVLVAAGCRGADDPAAAPPSTTAPSTAATQDPPPSTEPPRTVTSASTGSTAVGGSVPVAPGETCDVPGGYPEPWAERPRYVAHLNVEPAKRLVTGDVAVRFTPDADTDRLVFRLWANAPRIGRAGGRLDITASWVNPTPPPPGDGGLSGAPGQPVAGRYEGGGAVAGRPGTIWILPGTFPAGRPVEARLEFRLTLPGAINDRVAVAGKAVRLGSAIPLLAWIRGDGWHTSPATALNAEAAASEVADWDVTVTTPTGLTVLATGEEAPSSAGGRPGDERTEGAGDGGALATSGADSSGSADATSPSGDSSRAGAATTVATRFVARDVRDWAATVAPMRVARVRAQGGRTEIVVGVGEGAAGDPDVIAARHAKALDELAARFGEYPYPRLTIGVTAGLTGGIEFPTHIFLGSGSGPQASVHLVHEVAHQWFYGLVGNDQHRDPWLDEGLATYGQARVDGQLAYQRSRVIPAAGRGHLGESMAYWGRNGGAYHPSVYIAGLQALAKYGDQLGGYAPLDCALRRYVRDRAHTVARPADLLASLGAATGVDPAPILAPLGVR